MQSLSGKVISALLCAIFHSPLINNSELSNKAGKKTKKYRSHYKPAKEFDYSICELNGVNYEILEPKRKGNDKVVLLLHGGSYKVRLIDMYRRLSEKISRTLGCCMVYNLDYRTFPEYKYPAQIEDTVALFQEMLRKGIKAEDIVIIGDSAGANLALASTLYMRDNGMKLPAAVICFSLWGDATNSGKSIVENCYRDPFGGIARRKKPEENWDYLHRISAFAKDLDRTSPYVSPSFADFTNFPPVTLICGEAEMDRSANELAYENMRKVGVDVELHMFDGMFHDFQLIPFFPETKRAFGIMKDRIKQL